MRNRGAGKAPCRRFTLLDALILVGGSAVGFAGLRELENEHLLWSYRLETTVGYFLMLASWMVLIFRLRRPRPPIRWIARQPGAVACVAVVALQAVQFVDTLLDSHTIGEMGYLSEVGSAIRAFLADFDHTMAAVVPLAWGLLAAGRWWRPEPGWIDRSGRLVGWAWIAFLIGCPVLDWLTYRYGLNGPPRSIM